MYIKYTLIKVRICVVFKIKVFMIIENKSFEKIAKWKFNFFFWRVAVIAALFHGILK